MCVLKKKQKQNTELRSTTFRPLPDEAAFTELWQPVSGLLFVRPTQNLVAKLKVLNCTPALRRR